MHLLNTILDLILPVNCLVCGKSGKNFCEQCLSNAPIAERETKQWIYPLFDYRYPPIKKAIWLLKYNGKRKIAEIFAESIYGRILEELADLAVFENFRNPILIPIPLSRKRFRERGYNQSELLCRHLVVLDKNTSFILEKEALLKIKETEHQARIKNKSKRLQNLVGSFGIQQAERIKDRNIILIDDVTTTGTTLLEARKLLRACGAKKVIAFTIAH